MHYKRLTMKAKTAIKHFLAKSIVVLLLFANVGAYIVTSNYFASLPQTSTTEKKSLVRNMNTGWQMLDWSISLIDYFRKIGDSKN